MRRSHRKRKQEEIVNKEKRCAVFWKKSSIGPKAGDVVRFKMKYIRSFPSVVFHK